MLGQEVPIGTGATELVFDEEKYFQNVITKEREDINHVEKDDSDKFTSAYCDNLF